MISEEKFNKLKQALDGDLFTDIMYKQMYATDASVYRKLPMAVAYPKSVLDIKLLIDFANDTKITLIPRASGTSLAGQCVGEGIVVDISKHFNKIIEINEEEKTVTVQPGVIRDELNTFLAPFHLFFGPNTSTSNRCTIGGMVGNNSSGTTSIQYGVTRDKVLETEVLLSDGSLIKIKELKDDAFFAKTELNSLEGEIYRNLHQTLSPESTQRTIFKEFPKKEIHRRNTGYAIDELIKMRPFAKEGGNFNLNKLLCGSEGTLAFVTQIKLKLDPVPPAESLMIVAHFDSILKCCDLVSVIMKHNLYTCEVIDKVILDCTKNNKEQIKNRFFIEGDPEAILMIEIANEDKGLLEQQKSDLIKSIENSGLSYAYPILHGQEIAKAMELRKAGLGLLGNMIGDKKAVACIEDTAVRLEDLSDYIKEFDRLMKEFDQKAVYYAHAGAGELHLRPILNLKKKADVVLFRKITTAVAHLVKKYQGSLSGEHGDGIVRGEFIEMMVGKENYEVLKSVKQIFDPNCIFNSGKIINTSPMDTALRYEIERQEPEIPTILDFSDSHGILRAVEKCNGSGDCRKTEHASGGMCPSYHVTRNERDTTRARANVLREFLTQSTKVNKFNHSELKEVLDLCVSCKACASECPSNVDMATLKAEFQYQYQENNGYTLRDKLFANTTRINKKLSKIPFGISSFLLTSSLSIPVKSAFKIHQKRSLPGIQKFNQASFNSLAIKTKSSKKNVVLFIDEFSNYLDGTIANDTSEVLLHLGYKVTLFFGESGRSFISKGFLKKAKQIANSTVSQLFESIDDTIAIVGIEPSALLTLRDEYLRLCDKKNMAKYIAKRSFLIEEFISNEITNGNIHSSLFTKEKKKVKAHVHCHQKALSNQVHTFNMLNIPDNYQVSLISSGCCGMAGSFGYEKEHYDISMKMGALRLFPAVANSDEQTIIAANGTSCRHQIFDGTNRRAKHPITIFKEAMI